MSFPYPQRKVKSINNKLRPVVVVSRYHEHVMSGSALRRRGETLRRFSEL